MAKWFHTDAGDGEPVVLLHGIGMSSAAWKPVIPILSRSRRVIAFDIAGFGQTPPLPDGRTPTVPALAEALAQSLQAMGISGPVDMAGNSLGGYLSLEAAKLGVAKSVVAISPAGLWQEHGAPYVNYLFFSMRFGAKYFSGACRQLMKSPLMRDLLLAAPLATDGRKMPAQDAIQALEDMKRGDAFESTFANIGAFKDGQSLSIPITVAFGTRDWLLPGASRGRDQLPAHTVWLEPQGWGHVPMWQDPAGVARLILGGCK